MNMNLFKMRRIRYFEKQEN